MQHDPQFRDFNFSELYDPFLSPTGGPSSSWLYHVAYLSRRRQSWVGDFADAMSWTLKKASFDCFQDAWGRRPVSWEDWYHEKLYQFMTTFLYERLFEDFEPVAADCPRLASPPDGVAGRQIGHLQGSEPAIDWEKLPLAYPAQHAEAHDWYGLLMRLTRAGEDRVTLFNRIVDERIAACQGEASASAPESSAELNQTKRRSPHHLRNRLILAALAENLSRDQICVRLDVKGIPTLPSMQKLRVTTWQEAWEDSELRQSIQEMITRTIKRHGPSKA